HQALYQLAARRPRSPGGQAQSRRDRPSPRRHLRGPDTVTSVATTARRHALSRSLVHEAFIELVATAFLLIAVVGSGIMAERLCGGNVALALLANALATGAALVALILALGPISGAHFNPLVTLAEAMQGRIAWRDVPGYIVGQITGAFGGVAAAHGMFGLPIFFASHRARTGPALLSSEFIATFGLLAVI